MGERTSSARDKSQQCSSLFKSSNKPYFCLDQSSSVQRPYATHLIMFRDVRLVI